MLDPTWALTRPILWLALAVMLALLIVRTVRKDRREYRRFKSFTNTADRQRMFRRWLLDAFLTFGGLSVALLLLAGNAVGPLLREIQGWMPVAAARASLSQPVVIVVAAAIALALVAVTVVGIRAARHEADVVIVGDIRAMLPRNRQELRWGTALSINAGIVEEVAFRLAIPALVFGASGSALAAVLGSVLLFGALHLYQGAAGIIGTTIMGAIFLALYVITGSILVPILLHALFDLRSMVLIPVTVFRVHRVSGRDEAVPAP